MNDEGDRYAAEVHDQVFFATIRAIASLMHPKGISDAQRSLSLFATVDALLKVIAELLAEANLLDDPAVEAAMLADLQSRLRGHMREAKASLANRSTERGRSRADVH